MGKLGVAVFACILVLLSGVVAVGANQIVKNWQVKNIVDVENVPNVTYSASLFVSSSDLLDTPLTQILWGTVQNGTVKSAVIYAKNVGDASTTIHLLAGNFTVADPQQYLIVSAVIDQPFLAPSQSTTITVTLSSPPTAPSMIGIGFDSAIIAE